MIRPAPLVLNKTAKHSGDGIVPGMRDHSRANSSSPMSQNPEHRPERAEQNHPAGALVGMRRAECYCRKENAGDRVLCQCRELPLQITSKNRLLANSSANGERHT